MAKLLVLGATGGTGRQLVTQALEKGHDVTALVRDPSRFGVSHDQLHVVAGTLPQDSAALETAMRGRDVVISALGRGTTLKGFKSESLMERSVPVILQAMERTGVRRLLFISAFGVGPTWQDTPLVPRIFMSTLLRGIYADKTIGEAGVRGSRTDWTLIHPTGLNDGARTGKYRSGEHLALRGFPSIARADVADFVLTLMADSASTGKTLLVSQ